MAIRGANQREILRRIWLFAGLNEADLDEIGKLARLRQVGTREAVVHQGDDSGDLFAVVSGRLKAFSTTADGGDVVLSILESGDVFGEIALLDERPRSASVTSLEPCELVVVERRAFRALLSRVPDLGLRLMTVMARRLRDLSDHTEDVSSLQVERRLAKTLLGLAERFGERDPRGRVTLTLKLSQQDLANMVGATREFVNRQLRGWEERRILDLSGRLTVICDEPALREVSGLD